MEIEITQEKLAKALTTVSRVAMGAKSTLPILSNVLIRVDKEKVSLTTTNLDMAVVNYIPVINAKDGVVTAPARLLAEFSQNLPRGEKITLKADGNKITVKAGKYSSVINGASADDFPELPEIEKDKCVAFSMSVDDFKAGLSQVVIAASGDTTRPSLTGVYFNTYNSTLYVAATDGYRLADREFIHKVDSEIAAIVPTSSLQEVLRSIPEDAEEIEFLFDDTQVRFRAGELEITSKLINGTFPDYRELIPKNNKIEANVKRDELMRVVKIASLFARESNRAIICKADSKKKLLEVSSIANEVGENKSEVEGEISGDGEIRLDSRFLSEALNAFAGAEVKFGFNDGAKPLLITDEKDGKYQHLIMPLNS